MRSNMCNQAISVSISAALMMKFRVADGQSVTSRRLQGDIHGGAHGAADLQDLVQFVGLKGVDERWVRSNTGIQLRTLLLSEQVIETGCPLPGAEPRGHRT